jgi:hypothetical protein
MLILICGVPVEFDDDIAAELHDSERASNARLQRVRLSTSSLPLHLQAEAWQTYVSLLRDHTDRAMVEAVAAAEGYPELRTALQSKYDEIKATRIEYDRRDDD